MFKALGRRLPSLIRETIAYAGAPTAAAAHRQVLGGEAAALAVEVMKAIGFPFDRGRLDESEHPSPKACRATSVSPRASMPNDMFSGLLGALHETGHAMYDLGLPQGLA